jgi:hypothetical protein
VDASYGTEKLYRKMAAFEVASDLIGKFKIMTALFT